MIKVITKYRKCYLCGIRKKILYEYQGNLYCKKCYRLIKEGYIDDQHLGFVVEDIDIPHMRRYTLIDLINTGWNLHITKTKPKVKVKLIKGKTIYKENQ